ncbi:MAG: tRNA epoxyqueuosine(34) reductase QueG [Planctomycetaceae bacterium]|jgi:epoxyqueuosine reductase|nr:tRNA epoxyqueuosine(34) reductase QueG [Planctomycetaceae bacterium]
MKINRVPFDYGFVPAGEPKTFSVFEQYIDEGMNAGMTYLAQQREPRRHPGSVLPGVQTLMMLAVPYSTVHREPHPVQTLSGIAEYARGTDYHVFIRKLLKQLAAKHQKLFPTARCRGVVDTAPLMEKDFAVQAGLGFIGKNTLLIHPQYGSKLFLAALLTTERIQDPRAGNCRKIITARFDGCGSCTRCLDACPTGALTAPYILDARKCLNYWTIEQNGAIPADIAAKRGRRFFGCDTCQSVCPFNQHLPKQPEGTVEPDLLHTEELRRFAAGSPLERQM